MMLFLKRTAPVLVCFLVGVVFLAQYYVPTHQSQEALRHGANTVKILIGFSYLIGLQSLAHLHWSRIRRGQAGWGYSALVFVGLTAMLVTGFSGEVGKLIGLATGTVPAVLGPEGFQRIEPEGWGSAYNWLIEHVYNPSLASMFSLLAFFIASAAYRTFRARTLEAALLLTAALVVLFGRVPISAGLGFLGDFFPLAADWIMAFPNAAVKRGIFIGVSLGIVGTALRVIFGIERSYIGGD